MSPNQVSFVGIGLWVAGSALQFLLLARGSESIISYALVALLFTLAYVLDSADGQLARFTGAGTVRGAWVDHTLDAFRLVLVPASALAGVAVGMSRTQPVGLGLLPAALALIASANILLFVVLELSPTAVLTRADTRSFTVRQWVKQILVLPLDTGIVSLLVLTYAQLSIAKVVFPLLAMYLSVFAVGIFIREFRRLGTLDSDG